MIFFFSSFFAQITFIVDIGVYTGYPVKMHIVAVFPEIIKIIKFRFCFFKRFTGMVIKNIYIAIKRICFDRQFLKITFNFIVFKQFELYVYSFEYFNVSTFLFSLIS